MSPDEIAMREIRFTEHPIIAVLKSVEAGRTVKDVCREAAISEASYYNWKAKYGGMEAADIKKIKDLEDKMLLSNGSTGHTGQKSWMFTCSEH